MTLAWARLGVPEEYVQWLTNLDEDGLTFFLSPFMANNLQTLMEEPLLSSSSSTCSASTQGDTMATICSMVTPTPDLAFQQVKADLVSSFCAFSCMTISIPRSRLSISNTLMAPSKSATGSGSPLQYQLSECHLKTAQNTWELESHSAISHINGVKTSSELPRLFFRREEPQDNADMIEVQLIPQILYVKTHANWPLNTTES